MNYHHNNGYSQYPIYNQQYLTNNNTLAWCPLNYSQQSASHFNGYTQNSIPPNHPQHHFNNWQNTRSSFKSSQNQHSNPGRSRINHQSLRCEPCERDFNSENSYLSHKKQHVMCEAPGCQYSASSKAVKLHYIQTHEKGRFRIVLTTPEEIKIWRAERKRNWPSKTNIERKKEKKTQNTAGGIVLETKEFVYKGQPRLNNTSRKRGNHMQGIREKDVKKVKVEVKTIEVNKRVTSGLSLLQNYEVDSSSDAENQVEEKRHDCSTKKEENLLQTGEDVTPTNDDLEDGEIEDTENETKEGEEVEGKNVELPERFRDILQDKKERRRNYKQNKGRDNQKKVKGQAKVNSKKNVSLLEMLLAKEIRHERNVILQCVKYIVHNNYLN